MFEIVFIEFFRRGDPDDLIEVAVLRDFSTAEAHGRVLVQDIPSDILHVPLCLFRVMLNPKPNTIVVKFGVIGPKKMTKAQLK